MSDYRAVSGDMTCIMTLTHGPLAKTRPTRLMKVFEIDPCSNSLYLIEPTQPNGLK